MDKLYPGSLVDDYIFDPCGYSSNGLFGPYYYTFHVTPEPSCSYASFETTIPISASKNYSNYSQIIQKVIDIFQPSRFSTVVVRRNHQNVSVKPEPSILGFKHRERILHSLGRWEVSFCLFEKHSKDHQDR